jgi:hypothetical protein
MGSRGLTSAGGPRVRRLLWNGERILRSLYAEPTIQLRMTRKIVVTEG